MCSPLQKYTNEQAVLRLLKKGKEVTERVSLAAPNKLIPFHIKGKPPSYFIVAGLVFTPATVPYLRSEYGKEYDFDAPVSTSHCVPAVGMPLLHLWMLQPCRLVDVLQHASLFPMVMQDALNYHL